MPHLLLRSLLCSAGLATAGAATGRRDVPRVAAGDDVEAPDAPDTLLSPQDYARVRIVRDGEEVTGVEWNPGENSIVFPRVGPLER